MAFLDWPSWYGKPILTRTNVRRFAIALSILIFFAALLGLLVTGLSIQSDADSTQRFVESWVLLTFILAFGSGWVLLVFFWFRLFVNYVAMRRSLTDGARKWNLDRIINPRHGWRDGDLTAKGQRHRTLTFEGLIGFVAVQAIIWSIALLGQAVGLDLIAS